MRNTFMAILTILLNLGHFGNAQSISSIQFTGGVNMPMSSSKGLTGIIQYNYSYNKNIHFYIYTGYYSWDKYKEYYFIDNPTNQSQLRHETYSSDDHALIPLYIGTNIDIHSNKIFTSYISAELGYSRLSYNSYELVKSYDPNTGLFIGYHQNAVIKKISEGLFGVGLGAGIYHPLTTNVNLLFSFKLNSYWNSNYHGLFSTNNTYTTYTAGFNVKI